MPCSLRLLRVEKPTDRSEKAFKKGSAKPTRSKNSFFDSDLKTLLKNSKKGIIYIWSPHMPYSVGSLYPLKKMAKKWNIPLTVLMDPNAHDEETTKVIKQFSLPLNLTKKNKAKKLLFQGSSLHYPNYFFYMKESCPPFNFLVLRERKLLRSFKNISSKKGNIYELPKKLTLNSTLSPSLYLRSRSSVPKHDWPSNSQRHQKKPQSIFEPVPNSPFISYTSGKEITSSIWKQEKRSKFLTGLTPSLLLLEAF